MRTALVLLFLLALAAIPGSLLPQHPTNPVTDIGLAAPVRPHDGGDAVAVKFQFGAVAK